MMKNILFLITLSFLCVQLAQSQKGKEQTIFSKIHYLEVDKAQIHIQKDDSFDGNYQFYLNNSTISQDFQYVGYMPFTDSIWNAIEYYNKPKEYLIKKVNFDNQIVGFETVTIGLEIELPNQKDGILILIDSEHETNLKSELAILVNDLKREGWSVSTLTIDREITPTEVKTKILDFNKNGGMKLTTLYLLGHIPVPYSGFFSLSGQAIPPDGHVEGGGNHTGAWPADLYYGDMDGNWTDKSVNYTESSQERNYNIPGDGKFDQTNLVSDIELAVGRVDFFDMPAFEKSELDLLKDYLNRAHLWRTGELKTVNRGLIDDNFKSLNITSTAYRTINSLIGTDSLFDDRDYMTELRNGSYLFSFAAGAGSYSSCSGIGTTTDFALQNINTIFTGIAGSYFGDWDSKNNILRAALASGALSSFWSGIPHWYLTSLGVGATIGEVARYSQNASFVGGLKTESLNSSQRKTHIALMGDPTLTLSPIVPAKEIAATETKEGIVLNWTESVGDFDGYNIYRIDEVANTSTKINSEIITQNTYIDVAAPSGKIVYQLRTVKLVNLANNSYYTMGHSSTSNTVNYISSVEFSLDDGFNIAPNPSNGLFRLQLPKGVNSIKSITIQDMTGRTVYELSGNWSKENTFNATLTNGTYMLIAKTDKDDYIEKIQIIR